MLRLFRSLNPFSFVVMLIYAAGISLHAVMHPVAIQIQYLNPVASVIFEKWFPISHLSNFTSALLAEICIAIQGILIVLCIQRFKIFPKPNLIPALTYILLCNMFPEFATVFPSMILSFFVLWILFKLFNLYNKQKVDTTIFDAGLLSGAMALIYFPAGVFSLFAIWSIFRLRSSTLREFIIFSSAILVLVFLCGTAFFWYNQLPEFLSGQFTLPHTLPDFSAILSPIVITKFVIMGGLFFVSLVFLSDRFNSNLIQTRKYLSCIILCFIFSLLCIFLSPALHLTDCYFLILPVSIIISYFISNMQNVIAAEAIHIGLLATVLCMQYINFTS